MSLRMFVAEGEWLSKIGLRVLVCGGRDYEDAGFLAELLDGIRPGVIAHGSAPGADTLADAWAKARGVPVWRYRAQWRLHGRAAGPIRNQKMLEDFKPDLVVAFPGGKGTADMIARAEQAGVSVIRVRAAA